MFKNLSELLSLVEINLKVRYRQTFIGFLWVISNPILLFAVQSVVFGYILKHAASEYYLYLFTGLLPWFYLSQTAEMGCTYIHSQAHLLKNLKIHPYKLIWSLVIENYLNLICSSLIIFSYIAQKFNTDFSFFVIYLLTGLWLILIVAHLTFIASLLNILFKDTKYILHFMFTILYFLTPSFYYLENVPVYLQQAIRYNPAYWVVSLFRISNSPEGAENILIANMVITLGLIALSWFVWKKFKSLIYLKL